jgi:hypothetical protein
VRSALSEIERRHAAATSSRRDELLAAEEAAAKLAAAQAARTDIVRDSERIIALLAARREQGSAPCHPAVRVISLTSLPLQPSSRGRRSGRVRAEPWLTASPRRR